MLARAQVRTFYDRLGSIVDWYGFCAHPAVDDLLSHAAFEEAESIFEFGCGTGRFAAQLLDRHLPSTATYAGIDLSPKMIRLARQRLARFGDRATVHLTDGEPRVGAPPGTFDRFVCTYVLDLLAPDDIRAVISEAHRVLVAGGLLCLLCLCPGPTFTSRLVTRAWGAVNAFRPSLLGGCRPIEILEFLSDGEWEIAHRNTVVQCGLPCAVVVAAKP